MLESEQRSILNKPNVELTLSRLGGEGGGGSARLTSNADTSITITAMTLKFHDSNSVTYIQFYHTINL